jgi:Cu/Zn superoxide dismutase
MSLKLTPFVVLAAAAAVAAPAPVSRAVAQLHPLEGSGVSGTVTFAQVEGGVKVSAKLSGLTPGAHGFHIHEFGDCSAPDGTSAGGHFNPTGEPHGAPTDAHRHAGDMGNITAAADGTASLEDVDSRRRRLSVLLTPGPRPSTPCRHFCAGPALTRRICAVSSAHGPYATD